MDNIQTYDHDQVQFTLVHDGILSHQIVKEIVL